MPCVSSSLRLVPLPSVQSLYTLSSVSTLAVLNTPLSFRLVYTYHIYSCCSSSSFPYGVSPADSSFLNHSIVLSCLDKNAEYICLSVSVLWDAICFIDTILLSIRAKYTSFASIYTVSTLPLELYEYFVSPLRIYVNNICIILSSRALYIFF